MGLDSSCALAYRRCQLTSILSVIFACHTFTFLHMRLSSLWRRSLFPILAVCLPPQIFLFISSHVVQYTTLLNEVVPLELQPCWVLSFFSVLCLVYIYVLQQLIRQSQQTLCLIASCFCDFFVFPDHLAVNAVLCVQAYAIEGRPLCKWVGGLSPTDGLDDFNQARLEMGFCLGMHRTVFCILFFAFTHEVVQAWCFS